MFNTIQALYKSDELPGQLLFQPLKVYHSFFAKKINECSGLKKIAWIVVNVASSALFYPPLLALSVMGMMVKLTGVYTIWKRNGSNKTIVDAIIVQMKICDTFSHMFSNKIVEKGWQMFAPHAFTVTKTSAELMCANIKQQIDAYSWQFKETYLQVSGKMDRQGLGNFTFELSIREKVEN